MTTLVRFAPSPTGYLHVGNLRGVLINWLFARSRGGKLLLRLDDTDAARSTPQFAAAIEEDLRWLGLDWDHMVRQSDRLERYAAAVEHLKATGRLYACYESAEELETKRKLLLARGRPPIYDRTGLRLSDEDKAALEAQGRRPHWRFELRRENVQWEDLARGPSHIDTGSLSDPVLIRSDGTPLYMLPSAVDDMELGVSHVIRGEDHVTNTAEQIQIFEALGAKPPIFGHFPLIVGGGGESLSKRLGSLSLRSLRDQGYRPMALLSLVARLGTSDAVEAAADLEALVESFDLSHFSRSAAKFDLETLRHLNARILHHTPFAAVAAALGDMGLTGFDEPLWQAVRPNIEVLPDARVWWQVVNGPVTPIIEDREFAEQAARLLPPGPWDHGTWKAWTGEVKKVTGVSGKALFLPLRLALTGLDHGPELKLLLPLMGPERVRARLLGEAAR